MLEKSRLTAVRRAALTGVMCTLLSPALLRAEGQNAAARREPAPAAAAGDIEVVQVTSDVYMIGGGGSNVTVNVGSQGLFVVDTGSAAAGAKVAAAIRAISDKPIRYIVNTSADVEHIGGNVEVNKLLGQAIRSREVIDERATIVAYETVLNRLSAQTGPQALPSGALPTSTFTTSQQDQAFNDQAIQLFHLPAAHTDGDTVVFFRRSDVVATGDLFDKTRYPVIDIAKGGSITGEIDAINWLLDLIVPGEKEEGGTMVVPGHGRLCDESEVMEYRDMLTIVRDRVKDMVQKGMTLEQVKAARPTFEYDPEYGPSDAFVEAMFRGLQVKR